MEWRSGAAASLALLLAACDPGLREAAIGDLPLESGEVLRDCRVGYRTLGELDRDRSNAVLLVPWFMGTSAELVHHVGPGKLVDSSRFFVIAVDSLGNGVSSSPSGSAAQAGSAFPRYSVRDMVEAQHRLVTRVLGLPRLRAVVGVSMGGMQVFHWITAHPEVAGAAVSVVGTPRFTPRDRARWSRTLERMRAETPGHSALAALRGGHPLEALRELGRDPRDRVRQGEALLASDVARAFGGSMERAAGAVRARLLVVATPTDELVDPAPALEFARLAGAQTLLLDGRCGHRAPVCEERALSEAVGRFLGN